MSLSRRLGILIFLCVMPMALAGALTLVWLYEQRAGEITAMAEQQVNVVDADLAGLMDSAKAMLATLAHLPLDSGCGARLDSLQRTVPGYSQLGIVEHGPAAAGGGNGAPLICASKPAFADALAARPAWLAEGAATGFHVGVYLPPPASGEPAPGALPLTWRTAVPGGRERVVVAMMDLDALGAHLAALRLGDPIPNEEALTVLDRRGSVLARIPDSGRHIGNMDPMIRDAGIGAHPRVSDFTGPDGRRRLVAFNADGVLPEGLSVAASIDPEPALATVQDRLVRAALLGLVAIGVALAIAAVAARRTIQRPAAQLLAAARRWSVGDFSARVEVDGDRSEFGFLARAFNQMASDIEARVADYETRVAERTRELSERNNRLQVEIAERRRAENGLHQAQKLQAVGQLAGGIAHDFNNLLATILGSLELIERRVSDADERLQALVTRAIEAVQRGSQLTSRLLAFSRRQRLAARPTDINRLITDLVALAASTLGRGVKVETRLEPSLWPAMVDAGQLEAAILNIALNARDAMPRGGAITIATTDRAVGDDHPDADRGDYVCIVVTDTGEGMAAEIVARAFEPFFTTKEPGKGSGLGLSQVYGLVRQSGGAASIQSTLGAGTTVTLLLPRAQDTVDAPVAPARVAPARKRATDLVLLVDDDPDVRHIGVQMLRDLGYEVADAADGEAALALVRDLPAPPSLLVLDYAMPGMNGLQLAARLRERKITAPMILATGYAELADDRSGIKPDAILHKPFSLAELERTLDALRTRAPANA